MNQAGRHASPDHSIGAANRKVVARMPHRGRARGLLCDFRPKASRGCLPIADGLLKLASYMPSLTDPLVTPGGDRTDLFIPLPVLIERLS